MKLSALRVGDIVRRGDYYDTYLGASTHPTDEDSVLAVWWRDQDILYYDETSWDEEVGNLISYRNNNLRELDKAFYV